MLSPEVKTGDSERASLPSVPGHRRDDRDVAVDTRACKADHVIRTVAGGQRFSPRERSARRLCGASRAEVERSSGAAISRPPTAFLKEHMSGP